MKEVGIVEVKRVVSILLVNVGTIEAVVEVGLSGSAGKSDDAVSRSTEAALLITAVHPSRIISTSASVDKHRAIRVN
jgi:hypothetical protein